MLSPREKELVQLACFLYPTYGGEAAYRALMHMTSKQSLKTTKERLQVLDITVQFVDGIVGALCYSGDCDNSLDTRRGYEAVLGFLKEAATIG